MSLENKNILIGVTGSIAAYKSAWLVRLLVKEKANVKVVMTPAAHQFISALTLATLSKNEALTDFEKGNTGIWNSHVDLGLWADLVVIAPASANTIAKMATGICDNLLMATYLSARCKVMVAPAMDLDMWEHPATQKNIEIIKQNGNQIIEPGTGELASGLDGKGRMAEPDVIFEQINRFFYKKSRFSGKRVLISAGPTQEDLDPVRYISNHSSGKMGYEIARKFAQQDAKVILVSGPTALPKPSGLETIFVRTASEMLSAMQENHSEADIVVFSAAVADYRPKEVATFKIKKKDSELNIELEKTEDIAAVLGQKKSTGQVHVGFALETNDEEFNAKSKLDRKNFDLIVLNSLQDKGAGFRYDTNKVTVFDKKGKKSEFGLKSKTEVANDLLDIIQDYIVKD
ncbi:MAG: bifunctional phosphopantothenoylcysteine decarboxylase/phosphopantothenate--cysteine ligase CoaBC [Cytophagaceae bacterium]|nr:bifunctional phosphopantothenoylcysteine decarboxylase/phosphopantothenate--cysteine ligase CoaBC [Cytophagaceae bacterium]